MEKVDRWVVITTNPDLEILVYSDSLSKAKSIIEDTLRMDTNIIGVVLQSTLVEYLPLAVPDRIAVFQLSRN